MNSSGNPSPAPPSGYSGISQRRESRGAAEGRVRDISRPVLTPAGSGRVGRRAPDGSHRDFHLGHRPIAHQSRLLSYSTPRPEQRESRITLGESLSWVSWRSKDCATPVRKRRRCAHSQVWANGRSGHCSASQEEEKTAGKRESAIRKFRTGRRLCQTIKKSGMHAMATISRTHPNSGRAPVPRTLPPSPDATTTTTGTYSATQRIRTAQHRWHDAIRLIRTCKVRTAMASCERGGRTGQNLLTHSHTMIQMLEPATLGPRELDWFPRHICVERGGGHFEFRSMLIECLLASSATSSQ